MILTKTEFKVFYELFHKVCRYYANEEDDIYIKLYRIRINSLETKRHQLLVMLLVHNKLEDFVQKRTRWILNNKRSIINTTSKDLEENISNVRVTFPWNDEEWYKLLSSVYTSTRKEIYEQYVEKDQYDIK